MSNLVAWRRFLSCEELVLELFLPITKKLFHQLVTVLKRRSTFWSTTCDWEEVWKKLFMVCSMPLFMHLSCYVLGDFYYFFSVKCCSQFSEKVGLQEERTSHRLIGKIGWKWPLELLKLWLICMKVVLILSSIEMWNHLIFCFLKTLNLSYLDFCERNKFSSLYFLVGDVIIRFSWSLTSKSSFDGSLTKDILWIVVRFWAGQMGFSNICIYHM